VHLNQEGMYAVGVDNDTGTPVMEAVAGSIGMYTVYFRLTDDELNNYPNNKAEIDKLAYHCARGKVSNRELK
jgi:hypothetical protein